MGFYDDVQAAAATVIRLGPLEKLVRQQAGATDAAVEALSDEVRSLDRRVTRLEARLDAQEALVAAQVQAAVANALLAGAPALRTAGRRRWLAPPADHDPGN